MPRLATLLTALTLAGAAGAAEPTVGWLGSGPGVFDGYTLFAPMPATDTYLIDGAGRVVHTWPSAYRPGISVYLLDSGQLLRSGKTLGGAPPISAGGWGGLFQRIEWDGTVSWEFTYSSPDVQHHHDVEILPNGNVLMIAWERKTAAEAIAAGRDPSQISQNALWPEHIIEVNQTGPTSGQIVWEWHLWDHLIQDFDPGQGNFGVVAEHPELVDINAKQGNNADWIHANSIDYHPGLDQILISAHHLDEIWIIDHSTSTAEAAGHTGGDAGRGGDLIFRWGNPENYGAGSAADQKLFHQHCVEWIPEGHPGSGNILIFNNGQGRPGGNYTSIDEITPPLEPGGTYTWPAPPGSAFGPAALTWTYNAPNPFDFFASFISGARRLPNGNTVICNGPAGTFFEVDPAGNEVWRYVMPFAGATPVVQGTPSPNTSAFRTIRLPADHPGLLGQTLTPGNPIEIYPTLGDFDVDGDVDLDDLTCFEDLFTGPGSGISVDFADAAGFFGDFDGDGDLDCDDGLALEAVYTAGAFPGLPACVSGTDFTRGDANLDDGLDIADAIAILGHLFSGGALGCESAADSNDDSALDISDAIALLDTLFGSGTSLPPPNVCDADPTPDSLGCATTICP